MSSLTYELSVPLFIEPSAGIAWKLNRCAGLTECKAVIVCETDFEGIVTDDTAVVIKRCDDKFAPADDLVRTSKCPWALHVILPKETQKGMDSLVVVSDPDTFGIIYPFTTNAHGTVPVTLQPGMNFVFFGTELTPHVLFGNTSRS